MILLLLIFARCVASENITTTDNGPICPIPLEIDKGIPSVKEDCGVDPISANFETSYEGWSGNIAAKEELTRENHDSQYLRVYDRIAAWQGPILDMTFLKDCLSPNMAYMLAVDIRLRKNGTETDCFASGGKAGCPKIVWNHMTRTEKLKAWTLRTVDNDTYTKDNEWFTWRTDFMLQESYIEATDIFQALAINGPEPNVEMHMDNLRVYLPANGHFADPTAVCDELIINGGADASDRITFPFESLMIKEKLLIKKDDTGNNYFSMQERSRDWSGPSFTLDKDCLREDSEFEFNARIWIHDKSPKESRIIMKYFDENKKSKFVTIAMCPRSSETIGWVDCPGKLKFTAQYFRGPYVLSWMTHQTTAPTDWDNMKLTAIEGKCGKVPEVILNEDGTVNVTASLAIQKSSTTDEDPMGMPSGLNPNKSSSKTNPDGSYAGPCKDTDFNRDVEKGDLSFWKVFGLSNIELETPGYDSSRAAIKVTKRKTFWSSVSNKIEPKCLVAGKPYRVQAKIKLEREGKPYDCVPGKYWGPDSWKSITCPVLAIRARAGTKNYDIDAGKVYKWNSGEWNDIFGVFVVTDDMAKADTVEAWFTKFHQDTDIIIDKLSIQPETGYGCNQNIVHNYDFRYLDSRSWEKYWSGSIDMWDFKDENGKDKKAAAYSGFKGWHEGIGQAIDPNCIDLDIEYEVSVDVQIFENDKTTVARCDPEVNYVRKVQRGGCPVVVIADQKPKSFPKYTQVAALDQTSAWNDTTWNTMSGTLKFSRAQLVSPRLWIQVSNGKPGQAVIVNKLILKKKGAIIDVEEEATVAPGQPTPVPIQEVGNGDCTRDVKVSVDAEIDPNLELVITNADKSVTAEILSSFVSIDDKFDTHWYVARRFFTFSLSDGDWTGSFQLDGNNTWPVFSEAYVGDTPSCNGYMKSFQIAQSKKICNEVIRNGDFEETNDVKLVQWYHSGCGLNFTDEGVAGKALSTQGRTSIGHGLIQFLDTTCMVLDTSYDIHAKIKLVKRDSNDTVTCDPELRNLGSERCPRASIRSSKDGNPSSYNYGVANTLGPFKPNDWNYVFGSFVVNEDMSNADQVAFYFDGVREGVEIIIDDVSIVPSPSVEGLCLENTDFEVGDSRGWSCTGKSTCGLKMIQPGYGNNNTNGKPSYALSTTRRDDTTWGIAQVIDKNCTSEGDMYEITAYVKLQDYQGIDVICDPYVYYQGLDSFCPVIILQDSKRNRKREIVSSVAGPYQKGEWNLLYGFTTITKEMKDNWESIELFIGWGGKNKNIVVDDIVLKPTTADEVVSADCTQLVKNGDAEVGDARWWYIKGAGNFGKIEVNDGGASSSAKYFAHTGSRSRVNMGMWQELDKSCMALNSKWKISSMFKYFDANGNAVVCARPGQMCPKFRVEVFNGAGAQLTGTIYNNEKTLAGQWNANDWNAYEATFTMTQDFFDRERIFIYILAPENHSYHVDNIKVEPIS